jgi:uracil-DNA glycosylase family 4
MEGPATEAWRSLSEEIQCCRRCPLGATRTQAVIYRGGATPTVVLVGEAPGAEEDRLGRPFVGRSGRRLDAALTSAGLTEGEFGIINLLKCRPPENRFDASAADCCRPFLDRQLAELRPRLLIPLGARALQALDRDAPPITKCAGQRRPGSDPAIFPLLHPAAALHAPRLRAQWDENVQALGAEVRRLRTSLL